MKKFIDFLTQNNEPVGLKALNLEKQLRKNRPEQGITPTQIPWEVPLFVKQGDFYKSLKEIEKKL